MVRKRRIMVTYRRKLIDTLPDLSFSERFIKGALDKFNIIWEGAVCYDQCCWSVNFV